MPSQNDDDHSDDAASYSMYGGPLLGGEFDRQLAHALERASQQCDRDPACCSGLDHFGECKATLPAGGVPEHSAEWHARKLLERLGSTVPPVLPYVYEDLGRIVALLATERARKGKGEPPCPPQPR